MTLDEVYGEGAFEGFVAALPDVGPDPPLVTERATTAGDGVQLVVDWGHSNLRVELLADVAWWVWLQSRGDVYQALFDSELTDWFRSIGVTVYRCNPMSEPVKEAFMRLGSWVELPDETLRWDL